MHRSIEGLAITDRSLPFRSVLYVDDDRDIRSVVQATLRLVPDLVVETAESGERAIEMAYELRPDLVLMDVMMPGLDGLSAFQCMQESVLLANIPVIFMTAKALPTEISQFMKLGAIGVVVKPFEPQKLYADLLALWNREDADYKTNVGGKQSQVQAQVDTLTLGFLERARADAIRLSTMIGRAKGQERTVFLEMERIAHSIHGAAAMFGFPKLSEAGATIARIAEGLKAGTRDRPAAHEASLLQKLLESSEQLAHEVENASQTMPEKTAMFQRPLMAK